ncbi:MAG TPA: S1/P1 nuclease [Pyrinomonadaceae bacterium]|nr:S1/P1 nuclease [Pyrinomonadaceae bacterium]
MRKLFVSLAVAASLLCLPVRPARAWNGAGHMIVARIAYANLSDSTRARVDQLLRSHPDFTSIRQRTGLQQSHPDFGLAVFMRAATWPDDIKGDPRFHEDGEPPTPPRPGFPSMERHRGWHFIDTPFSTDGAQTAPAPEPNAITELPRLVSEIGNPAFPRNRQAYDLAWLLHLAGDVHQPLHSTARFTTRHGPPEGDRGGNLFIIRLSQNSTTNLHSFWDGLLGTSTTISSVKGQGTSITNAFPPQGQPGTSPKAWADESFGLRERVYSIGSDSKGAPTPRVTQSYRNDSRLIARERAALAGYRIAAILNERLP